MGKLLSVESGRVRVSETLGSADELHVTGGEMNAGGLIGLEVEFGGAR